MKYVIRMGILRSSTLHSSGAPRPAIEEANANAETPVPDELSYTSAAIVIPTEYMVVKAIAANTWPIMMSNDDVDMHKTKYDVTTQIAPKENRDFLPNLSDSNPIGTLERKRTKNPTETIIPI
jgi:hypothetical protein